MTIDITYKIAALLRQTTPDLETRLGYQTEALAENKCINPIIGQWIDANDVKYLLSALDLEDKDFAAIFPSIAHFTRQNRQQLAAAIESHFEHCKHCSLKRGYDLEIDAQIKTFCLQNRDSLLQFFEDDADASKTEVQIGKEQSTDSFEDTEQGLSACS